LVLSIVLAIAASVCLTLNAITIQQCVRVGVDVTQASVDANILIILITLPLYIVNIDKIDGISLLYGTLVQLFANIGIVFGSLSLACGDAGPVTAIEN
jgi:hypothetical protein